jgi:hypothetical protein
MKKSIPALMMRLVLLPIGLCTVLSCGKDPFSSSTAIGQNIVEDVQPGVTNVDQNIKSFTGFATVDSSFSMRDVGDSILPWSHRNMSSLAAGTFPGVSGDVAAFRDTAYAYIEFRPGIFRQSGHESERSALKSAYSIDSVVFMVNRFRATVDSAFSERAAVADINLFECDTMKDSDVVAFTKGKDSSTAIGVFPVQLDSAANDTVYSVKLDTKYSALFKRAVSDSASYSGDTAWFAFCLRPAPSSSGVVRFDNANEVPRIRMFYRIDSTDTVLRSVTLNRHHGSFTVFEQDSIAACGRARASWQTGRRAVLKLGVSSLRDFMDTSAKTGERYAVIQHADLKIKLSGLFSDMHADSVSVKFCIADTLARSMKDFVLVSSFYVRNTGGNDTTTYTLSLAPWLQKTIVQKKSGAAFLYLMTPMQSYYYAPAFIQIDWTQPSVRLELHAIVTNPRSM